MDSVLHLVEFMLFSVYYYRPQRSWAKVMFLQASVILLTGGGCVCLSASWNGLPQEQTPPGSRHPPRADTPRSRHPRKQTPPGSRHPQSRHPLGADTPPEADSGIQSTSGWYASYWNAFLLNEMGTKAS